MNWEAVGALAELAGAAGVIITLVYLSGQIRQSNRHARAQARQWMAEQANFELHQLMADAELSELFERDVVTPEQSAKLNYFLAAAMRQREWEWFQYRDGIISQDVYEAYHGVIKLHLGTRRTRRWWQGVGRTAFNPEFTQEVDQLLCSNELTTYFRDIKSFDESNSDTGPAA